MGRGRIERFQEGGMYSLPHRPEKHSGETHAPNPGDRSGLKTHKRRKRSLLKTNDGADG